MWASEKECSHPMASSCPNNLFPPIIININTIMDNIPDGLIAAAHSSRIQNHHDDVCGGGPDSNQVGGVSMMMMVLSGHSCPNIHQS